MAAKKMTIAELLQHKSHAENWKWFVGMYVYLMTSKKKDRELVKGYQVKKLPFDNWTILYNGKDVGYGTMTGEVLYTWMQRLPLNYYRQEADNLRNEILLNN